MFLRPSDYPSPLEMPNAEYDEAFTLLEQSFKDSSFLEAYKSLPSRLGTETAHSSSDLSDDHDDSDSSSSSEGSMHQGYGPKRTPPISLVRNNSELPPTPPSFANQSVRPHLVPLPAQSSGVTTPLLQQSPPTPDLTPPSSREKELTVPRPNLPHYPSSRAESFFTAREDQSQASAHTSQSSLPLRSEATGKWLDSTRSIRLGGLKLERPEEVGTGSREATPTQENSGMLAPPPMVQYIIPEDHEQEESSGRETPDTNFMRNVTIRKKRSPQKQTDLKQDTVGGNHKKIQSLRMPNLEDSTESPSTIKDGETLEWPEIANDHLYRHIRNEKSKRLSGASNTSTVVEAIVLSDPPQRKPTLRRVSKHGALRDDVSSKRSSSDSAAAFQHRLRHRKSPLPVRKDLMEGMFDSARAVSDPETQRRDRVPVIVVPERRSSHSSALVESPEKSHLLTSPQHRLYHTKPNSTLLQDYKDGENPRPSLGRPNDIPSRSWLDDASPEPVQKQPGSRLRHVSAPIYVDKGSTDVSMKDALSRIHGITPKVDLRPKHGLKNSSKQGWKRHSLDAELASPEHEKPLRRSRPATSHNESSGSIDDRIHSFTLKPDNLSTGALFEHSLQSSPHKSTDGKIDMNVRYLHPSATPVSISQISDRTDAMEVNEAKAVNLYPHENTSLVVIQHIGKTRAALDDAEPRSIDQLTTPDSEKAVERLPSQPTFNAVVYEPHTPPVMEQQDPYQVDSPLRNPRQAPQPPRLPAINFIPATPVPPEDTSEEKPDSPTEEVPERRPSLVEKARRYSESLIQPFLSRTNSRRSTSSQRPQSAEDRGTTLHPFWRPRGFWDDFESESDDDYDDEPLPRGGDTSDIGSDEEEERQNEKRWNPRRMSVRMRGFRGNGGFLTGNTLGIERHGTNSRRHYITKTFSRRNTDSSVDSARSSTLARILPSLPSLRKRKSQDLLRVAATSTESLRRLAQRGGVAKRRRFGNQLGFQAIKNRIRNSREEKEERERERLRTQLKGLIGTPVYQD